MSTVLDTHTALWYLEDSKELSTVARTTIEEAVRNASGAHVWSISVIETSAGEQIPVTVVTPELHYFAFQIGTTIYPRRVESPQRRKAPKYT